MTRRRNVVRDGPVPLPRLEEASDQPFKRPIPLTEAARGSRSQSMAHEEHTTCSHPFLAYEDTPMWRSFQHLLHLSCALALVSIAASEEPLLKFRFHLAFGPWPRQSAA